MIKALSTFAQKKTLKSDLTIRAELWIVNASGWQEVLGLITIVLLQIVYVTAQLTCVQMNIYRTATEEVGGLQE